MLTRAYSSDLLCRTSPSVVSGQASVPPTSILPPMILDQTLGSTIGAALLGGFADAILYGIATSQCFTFFQSQRQRGTKDSILIRGSVGLLWIFSTVHTALILQPLYWYMIQNFGVTTDIVSVAWGFRGSVVVTAVSDAVVRTWFIYRIWKLSEGNRWLSWPLLFLNLSLFGVTLTMAIWSCFLHTLEEFAKIAFLFYTTFTMVVVVDVSIAISLLVLFTKMKDRDFFHKHADLLTKLISYTVNTGLVTSIVSGMALVIYALMPENYIFLAIGFPLSGRKP
ncbi:hypothetical protein PHLGIDRAFT_130452 [Phlebiopsis gigantea 11061_1 CR5-6]|uniref:DUF6534 domain-containing protein n=1 Tax=Phlebiopsis gigantea (strain 11061_1 CR5-6) TaxID=745531 RepID=A0A0C3S4F0_PHLG1|nr:hypothetical protein PHLGIDRAFT_130452 [Phlebiopsis gigantea 11061_1 CR5-6]